MGLGPAVHFIASWTESWQHTDIILDVILNSWLPPYLQLRCPAFLTDYHWLPLQNCLNCPQMLLLLLFLLKNVRPRVNLLAQLSKIFRCRLDLGYLRSPIDQLIKRKRPLRCGIHQRIFPVKSILDQVLNLFHFDLRDNLIKRSNLRAIFLISFLLYMHHLHYLTRLLLSLSLRVLVNQGSQFRRFGWRELLCRRQDSHLSVALLLLNRRKWRRIHLKFMHRLIRYLVHILIRRTIHLLNRGRIDAGRIEIKLGCSLAFNNLTATIPYKLFIFTSQSFIRFAWPHSIIYLRQRMLQICLDLLWVIVVKPWRSRNHFLRNSSRRAILIRICNVCLGFDTVLRDDGNGGVSFDQRLVRFGVDITIKSLINRAVLIIIDIRLPRPFDRVLITIAYVLRHNFQRGLLLAEIGGVLSTLGWNEGVNLIKLLSVRIVVARFFHGAGGSVLGTMRLDNNMQILVRLLGFQLSYQPQKLHVYLLAQFIRVRRRRSHTCMLFQRFHVQLHCFKNFSKM